MGGRRLVLLLVLASLAMALLVGLGFWQLQRMEWKNALIADLERSIAAEPVAYAPPADPASGSRQFQRVVATGHFDSEQTVHVLTPSRGRPGVAGFGYHVFTPLVTPQGTVIVNRGYVPNREALASQPRTTDGVAEVTVRGIIRDPDDGGGFVPKPKVEQRLFYSANVKEMAAAYGWAAQPSFITGEYIEADTTNTAPGMWPQGRDPQELLARISNRHLEYALTWFGLAATLFAVTLLYVLRGSRRHTGINM
jgi:surfeit locus 1 family protein